MSGHWVRNGPEYPHNCRTPRRRERNRIGVRDGAVWQCGVCDDRWSWESGYEDAYWVRRPRKYGESE